MSQKNAVYSETSYHNAVHPPANGRSDRLEREDGNGALSTIRFDMPCLQAVSENEEQSVDNEKDGRQTAV